MKLCMNDVAFSDLYLMCLVWDDNYSDIACGMLMVKTFQGKFLVVWLVMP